MSSRSNLAVEYLSVCCPPLLRIYKVTRAGYGNVWGALIGGKTPLRKLVALWGKTCYSSWHMYLPNLLQQNLQKKKIKREKCKERISRLSECEKSCRPEAEVGWGLCRVKKSISCPSVRIVKEPAALLSFRLRSDVRPSCSEGFADSPAATLYSNINFHVFNKIWDRPRCFSSEQSSLSVGCFLF